MNGFDWPQLVWLLMALLLVSGAGYGFRRFRFDGRNALIGLVFWGAAVGLIVWLYMVFN